MDEPSKFILQVFSPSGKRVSYEIDKIQGDHVYGKILKSEVKASLSKLNVIENNEVCLDMASIKRMIQNMQENRQCVSKAAFMDGSLVLSDLQSSLRN